MIADQFYYNVRDVRTKDDTNISVKLMIFFELEDVEKMLDRTHDPVADFINAVASDTVQHCALLTYEQFVENTSQMNELETFGSLCSRAETIGYKINKVVFRGFHSSDALQVKKVPSQAKKEPIQYFSNLPCFLFMCIFSCRRCTTQRSRSGHDCGWRETQRNTGEGWPPVGQP